MLAGCAISPPLLPNGLPRVSRYTNSAQVEFLLSSYSAAAVAQQTGQQAQLDEACLGWERAVFDLQSAQRYPMLLRMSTESANLAAIWHDLPALAQRNPRPEACGGQGAGAEGTGAGRESPEGPKGYDPQQGKNPTPVPADTLPKETLLGQAGAPASATAATSTAAAPDGAASVGQAAVAQAPVAPGAPNAIQPPPAAMAVVGTAQPETKAGAERRALAQLRQALGMPAAPPFHFAQSFADPTVPLPIAETQRAGTVDLSVLQSLAESEIPTVRLRARFHLLGLCTLAVEASDRYGEALPPAQRPAAADKLAATDGAICTIAAPQGSAQGSAQAAGSLRQGQRRQLASLLRAWRAKYPEPMTDMVVALANFVSRDNPVVDGPRITR